VRGRVELIERRIELEGLDRVADERLEHDALRCGNSHISPMTAIGKGNASSAMTSTESPSWSSNSSVSRTMSGRRFSTVLGVKAFATSRRKRVWSGGSRPSMELIRRSMPGKRSRHCSSVRS